jgi:hypothetical protein
MRVIQRIVLRLGAAQHERRRRSADPQPAAERLPMAAQAGGLAFKGKHLHATTPTIDADISTVEASLASPACHRLVNPRSLLRPAGKPDRLPPLGYNRC